MAKHLAAVVSFGVVGTLAACGSSQRATPSSTGPVASSAANESSTSGVATTGSGATPSTSAVPPSLASVALSVRRLEHPIVEPTAMVDRPGHKQLWVTERIGYVSIVDRGKMTRLIDMSSEVSTNGERGLLGIEFSLDGRWLYLSFTDEDGDNRIIEYEMGDELPELETRRDVIEAAHPFTAHHGGGLATGPDGLLYIGWGDGEAPEGDKEHAQSLSSLLGKMLRIDPRGDDEQPYAIPDGNPFEERDGARPEVFAFGLRNPWRFSFDRETGDAWIGDVGEYQVEEVSYVPASDLAGANFGWPFLEGNDERDGDAPDTVVAPLVAYGHGDRCAVIGGYVYRGTEIPELRGSYIYGDLCDSHVRALRLEAGTIVEERDFGALIPEGLVGFGEDATGELYVLSLPDGLFRLEGA
jgi:glucose/arabinose dehydrogenase